MWRKSLQYLPSTRGRVFWKSASMFNTLLGLDTSSIGESPLTVIVSSSVPMAIVMSTWKFAPARSRTASRRNTENPASSAVSA